MPVKTVCWMKCWRRSAVTGDFQPGEKLCSSDWGEKIITALGCHCRREKTGQSSGHVAFKSVEISPKYLLFTISDIEIDTPAVSEVNQQVSEGVVSTSKWPCNPIPVVLNKAAVCVCMQARVHTHILNYAGICMKVWVSVALAVCLASPVTCQSVTVRDGAPSLQPASVGAWQGTKPEWQTVTGRWSPLYATGRRLPLHVSPWVTEWSPVPEVEWCSY